MCIIHNNDLSQQEAFPPGSHSAVFKNNPFLRNLLLDWEPIHAWFVIPFPMTILWRWCNRKTDAFFFLYTCTVGSLYENRLTFLIQRFHCTTLILQALHRFWEKTALWQKHEKIPGLLQTATKMILAFQSNNLFVQMSILLFWQNIRQSLIKPSWVHLLRATKVSQSCF